MEVKVNGTSYYTVSDSLYALQKECRQMDAVIIVNGFQMTSDRPLKEQDEIFFITKGTMPPQEQLEQMMAARHTPGVHRKLKTSAVAVAGLGGLGSNVAVALARIGVGKLLLVDFDVVEPSNLNRQHYDTRHLGMPKTQALTMQLRDINPFITVEAMCTMVTKDNAVQLFQEFEVVCECFDKAENKAMLIDALLPALFNTKVVSASGMAGYASSNLIRTSRFAERLYICGDLVHEAQEGSGLMSPRVQICAGHQANMVLRLLLGELEV